VPPTEIGHTIGATHIICLRQFQFVQLVPPTYFFMALGSYGPPNPGPDFYQPSNLAPDVCLRVNLRGVITLCHLSDYLQWIKLMTFFVGVSGPN